MTAESPRLERIMLGVVACVIGVPAFIPMLGVLSSAPRDITRWPLAAFLGFGATVVLDAVIAARVGSFRPETWYLSGLVAWPEVLSGAYNLIVGISNATVARARSEAVVVLVLPLAITLASARGGSLLALRKAPAAPH